MAASLPIDGCNDIEIVEYDEWGIQRNFVDGFWQDDIDKQIKVERIFNAHLKRLSQSHELTEDQKIKYTQYWLDDHNKNHRLQKSKGCAFCEGKNYIYPGVIITGEGGH